MGLKRRISASIMLRNLPAKFKTKKLKTKGVLTKMKHKEEFTTWESLPDTITAKHIASYLDISRRRVYELCQKHLDDGGIPHFKIGASIRVDKSDFNQWIIQLKKNK